MGLFAWRLEVCELASLPFRL